MNQLHLRFLPITFVLASHAACSSPSPSNTLDAETSVESSTSEANAESGIDSHATDTLDAEASVDGSTSEANAESGIDSHATDTLDAEASVDGSTSEANMEAGTDSQPSDVTSEVAVDSVTDSFTTDVVPEAVSDTPTAEASDTPIAEVGDATPADSTIAQFDSTGADLNADASTYTIGTAPVGRINCGSGQCVASSEMCCMDGSAFGCTSTNAGACPGAADHIECEKSSDCPTGQLCYNTANAPLYTECSATPVGSMLCQSSAECGDSTTCISQKCFTGYSEVILSLCGLKAGCTAT